MIKFFKKGNIKFFKTLDKNNLGSLARIFLSSFVVIFVFYSLPLVINYTNNNILNSNEFINNSKVVLAYTLDKKANGNSEDSDNYDERDLLVDIYSLNEQETDTVRLDASTIKQLYEDTDYKLEDIRKNKLVKPIALTLLPSEIKMIENTTKRKEFFIQIVLPLILQENTNIRLDRKRLFNIINKSKNT
jgi:Bax protein